MTLDPITPIILASTSRYRADLLRRLRLPFEQCDPGIDEPLLPDEAPSARARRLARAKAAAVAQRLDQGLVIGSDQVAALERTILRKPGDLATAQAQLGACSGRTVTFHTAVCVLDACATKAAAEVCLDTTEVHFRALDATTIERYLRAEEPFDCAGSFRCEGLGVSLFEAINSSDPTALVGLPLIATARLLRRHGHVLP